MAAAMFLPPAGMVPSGASGESKDSLQSSANSLPGTRKDKVKKSPFYEVQYLPDINYEMSYFATVDYHKENIKAGPALFTHHVLRQSITFVVTSAMRKENLR